MILTFTDYIEPKTTASGKLTPAKAKASDGKTYVLGRAVVEQVRNALGVALEVTTSSKSREYNGKQYTDYTVETAKHPVAAAGPESPTTSTAAPTSQPVIARPADSPISVASRVIDQTSHKPFDSRSDEINRQSARRDAVSLVAAGIFPPDHLWDLIDKLAAYTYHSPEKTAAGAITPAHQHLETARQAAVDRRAGYSLEDAVCPNCGYRDFIKPFNDGFFCAPSKVIGQPGGCGYPPRGEALRELLTYGEWLENQKKQPVPWK